MKVIHIDGNGGGNCLFRSCAYHIGMDHGKLRQQVANIIRNFPHLPINGTKLAEWLKWLGHNHFVYSNYMSQNGIFGTAFELMIISIIYRRCIRVWKKIRDCEFEMIDEYYPEFGDTFDLLFSGPPNFGHYDPLIE